MCENTMKLDEFQQRFGQESSPKQTILRWKHKVFTTGCNRTNEELEGCRPEVDSTNSSRNLLQGHYTSRPVNDPRSSNTSFDKAKAVKHNLRRIAPQLFGKRHMEYGEELSCHEDDGMMLMLVGPDTDNSMLFHGVTACITLVMFT
jgi:hypothetical protein